MPVELAACSRKVLLRIPERTVIDGIDRHITVIAPAIARAGGTARAAKHRRFTLGQSI